MASEQSEENNLQGAPAVLQMTVHVTRKATGKVDTYELSGHALDEEPVKENQNGNNP